MNPFNTKMLRQFFVSDRASRLFSAQQESLQCSSGLNWLFRLMLVEIGRCDALVF
jgi:hypothetical protein